MTEDPIATELLMVLSRYAVSCERAIEALHTAETVVAEMDSLSRNFFASRTEPILIMGLRSE